MNVSKILSYIGLGIIGALLCVVVILSFVSTNHFIKVSGTKELGAAVAVAPDQITVSKYNSTSSTEYDYRMTKETKEEDYTKVLSSFNELGNFTVMQTLFLGISSTNAKIVNEQTKTFNALHKLEGGYLVEFMWTSSQTLLNKDGSQYKNSDGNTVSFTKIAIFVENSGNVQEYKVYVNTPSSDGSYSKYYYSTVANVKSLFNIAENFDNANKLSAKL